MEAESIFINLMDQLYRTALLMLADTQDAEDAVQEAYIRYLLKKPKLQSETHAKAWFMRVCINICKNQIRYRSRHVHYDILETDIIGENFGEQEIIRELSLLPLKLRTVLILYSIEGYSVKEIAQILKISESAVKKRLQRGREKLNNQLREG